MWLIALLALVFVGDEPSRPAPERGPTIDLLGEQAEPETKAGTIPVRVYVRNDMSDRFRLVEARVVLDETEVVHVNASAGRRSWKTRRSARWRLRSSRGSTR